MSSLTRRWPASRSGSLDVHKHPAWQLSSLKALGAKGQTIKISFFANTELCSQDKIESSGYVCAGEYWGFAEKIRPEKCSTARRQVRKHPKRDT